MPKKEYIDSSCSGWVGPINRYDLYNSKKKKIIKVFLQGVSTYNTFTVINPCFVKNANVIRKNYIHFRIQQLKIHKNHLKLYNQIIHRKPVLFYFYFIYVFLYFFKKKNFIYFVILSYQKHYFEITLLCYEIFWALSTEARAGRVGRYG